MIKIFCDLCEKEITGKNDVQHDAGVNRLSAVLEGKYNVERRPILKVEVMTSLNEKANGGEFCKHCILDALYKLDDRPQVVY